MSESPQEREFATFGFIDKRLRAGLLIGLLSLSICFNIYLVSTLIKMQEKLYQQMLDRMDKTVEKKVNEKLDEPVHQMNETVKKVNTSTDRVDSIANGAKQVLEQQFKSKK